MSDVVLLRTLARKSIITGGRCEGLAVQDVINMGDIYYLAYSYYRYSMISFLDDILDEIGITEDLRINKPGSDVSMHEEWKNRWRKTKTEDQLMHFANHSRAQRKRKELAFEYNTRMSKSNIRNKHRKLST